MQKKKWTDQEIEKWYEENNRFLYVNKVDANLFIRKRYGIAWTLNLGNSILWIIIVIFIAFICLVVTLTR